MATTVLGLWQAKDAIVETASMLVKNFFSPEHIDSQVGPVKFDCKLAPSFVDTHSLDKVSDNTKVMVGVSNKRLQGALPSATKFEDVQGQFNANLQIVLVPKKGGEEQINEIFSTNDKSFFGSASAEGPSEKSVESIMQWLSKKLITDPVVLATSGLDNPATIRGLITISGSNFELISNNACRVQDETLVVDVGILTYPSEKDQTLRLVNIKIYVWIKNVSVGGGVITKYEVGLRGSVLSQIYEPNAEGIRDLKPNTVEGAIKEYEKFVSEVHQFVKKRPSSS
ncbi:hypothetical protein B0H11DRAFT_1921915 [Mycena galericulata]|nr:hypothetical protein B0H11DRAFT_1921915 [Mycena galericulata]